MNKLRAGFYYIFLLIIIISFSSLIYAENYVSININGVDLTKELDPQLIEDEIFVKARSLADNLQVELKWFSAIKTLQLAKEDIEIKLMADNPYIQVNNKIYKSNKGLLMHKGHSYLPIKEIVEYFGYLYQREKSFVNISKPESFVKEICWQREGQQLLVKMDKLSPYRINKTDDPKKIILEIERAALSENFYDGLSNEDYYLRTNKINNKGSLRLTITGKYPIPFQIDKGISEDGNNLLINFLPKITAIKWQNDQLTITANGDIENPEIMILPDPKRMVIDIPGMMLNNYSLLLPSNDWIKDIRVSQFKYDPIILRVVIELKEGRYLHLIESNKTGELILKPSKITRVGELSCQENTVRFKTDNDLNPNIFILHKPERLVVNLLNSVKGYDFPQELKVSNEFVNKIRTSRFNDETVRLVVDLKKNTGYTWQKKQLTDGCYEHIIILKNSIEGIKFADSKEKTDININFTGKVNYEVKQFSYPDRLVVDVEGMLANLPEKELCEPLGLIKKVRISQFSNEPQIVRFVFELDKYYNHVLFSDNPAKSINISLPKYREKEMKNIIIIDPGHGGFDPGAIGPSGLKEKDINLIIAHKVRDYLIRDGYEVLLTREEDQFISLKDRVKIANEINGKIFVSIHINSFNEKYAEGTETYVASNKLNDSRLFAELIQQELIKKLKRVDRGVKEDSLYVINNTSMPAVLVEVAFISNPHEETLLSTELFRDRAAEAIYRGIKSYLQKIGQGDESSNG